jgi:hypothetical protein
MTRFAWLSLSLCALPACGVLVDSSGGGITYDLDPREFVQDFGSPTCPMMTNGNCILPTLDCTQSTTVCSTIQAPGAVGSCEMSSHTCVATFTKQLVQAINLSQE